MRFLLALTLLLFSLTARASRVDTLLVPSAAMHRTCKAGVVVPTGYEKSKKTYPVLYLLHGAYDHFDAWLTKVPDSTLLRRLADQYQMLIVLPEGDKFGFYLDSPINPASQFETHVTQEVRQKVEANYRVIKEKRGRMICGLSMGGHGALYLAARHPDLYAAAGGMSGKYDHAEGGLVMTKEAWKHHRELYWGILPQDSTQPQLYAPYSAINIVDKLAAAKIPLIIDCGVDDYLIEQSRELHRRLVFARVPHEYIERPGAHDWKYWPGALEVQVLFLMKGMKIP